MMYVVNWVFFLILGSVIFLPSLILMLILRRFKNTIKVAYKKNGSLEFITITDKELAEGEITHIGKKKIKPIKIKKEDIFYGKWRRWIIKNDLDSPNQNITDKEIEEYLNNEDLIKLYLAGKFKDTLIILLVVIIIGIIIGHSINGYQISNIQCLDMSNQSRDFIIATTKTALKNFTMI